MDNDPRIPPNAERALRERETPVDPAIMSGENDDPRWDESVGEPAAREAEVRYNRLEKDCPKNSRALTIR